MFGDRHNLHVTPYWICKRSGRSEAYNEQKSSHIFMKSVCYIFIGYTVYYLRKKISISSFNRYLNALQERLQHVEWDRFGTAGPKQFFALTYLEGKFCSTGKWSCNGHKKCKRKICALCGDRIKLQKRTLEVSSQSWVSWNFGVLHLRVIYLFPSEC